MAFIYIQSKKNKSKGTWYVDYYDQHGKRHRVKAGETKKDAELKYAGIRTELRDNRHVPPDKIPTFQKLGEEWLEKRVRPNFSLSAISAYEGQFRKHLAPYFGQVRLDKIDVRLIETYLYDRVKDGVSRVMANKTVTTLGTIFNFAKRHGYVNRNPVTDVEKLRKPPHEQHDDMVKEENIYSPQEVRLLIENSPDRYRTLLITAVLTGMRQSELLALRWGDVDWVSQQICVRRSLCRKKDREGRIVFNVPKTKSGVRRIDMAPELVKELKDWRTMQQLDRESRETSIRNKLEKVKDEADRKVIRERHEALKRNVEALDLTFPADTGNPDNHWNLLQRGFFPALKKAGLREIRFHDLRHTYASFLVDQGENIEYIRCQLGHASADITLRVYTHLFKKRNQGSAAKLGASIFGKQSKQNLFTTVSP